VRGLFIAPRQVGANVDPPFEGFPRVCITFQIEAFRGCKPKMAQATIGKFGNSVPTLTMRPDCAYGSGLRSTAFTTLKIAVVAPIPSARQSPAAAVNPGSRASMRRA
jgi:hypothetical protein